MTETKVSAQAAALRRELKLDAEYPFESRFVRTPQGMMHYVDEGSGAPVLLLHGNPTWSFLWRRFVTGLSEAHRVIAPDHIGFGLSEKPSDSAAYSIDTHIRNLEALVERLDLTDITLVMQDWGGPIGLGMAARHPGRIARLVVMNTFGFWPPADGMDPENLPLPAPLRLMRAKGPGDVLVCRFGFFERVVMRMATGDGRALRRVHHAYKGVFRSPAERAGVMAFPRLIPTRSAHPSAQILLRETGPFLERFEGPARIFWGMKDPLFPPEALAAWRTRLPQAEVTELPEAKHYLQEDAPEEIVAGLHRFLAA
ncbi:alpha/beta fold hydrolase [Pontivivens ytuae]|uniref:Alpha/beta fold hydrolase n=1 Tax=Pontivivens ytuae TaxID=2789856 RepID=A0A7S9LPC2_9RHOB|nr:alpha/beta fold hydrolase [Pontivivens ytuae]QPH52804.1 alpha/beta fold hydrolase [Pontivivens ytuae]